MRVQCRPFTIERTIVSTEVSSRWCSECGLSLPIERNTYILRSSYSLPFHDLAACNSSDVNIWIKNVGAFGSLDLFGYTVREPIHVSILNFSIAHRIVGNLHFRFLLVCLHLFQLTLRVCSFALKVNSFILVDGFRSSERISFRFDIVSGRAGCSEQFCLNTYISCPDCKIKKNTL